MPPGLTSNGEKEMTKVKRREKEKKRRRNTELIPATSAVRTLTHTYIYRHTHIHARTHARSPCVRDRSPPPLDWLEIATPLLKKVVLVDYKHLTKAYQNNNDKKMNR